MDRVNTLANMIMVSMSIGEVKEASKIEAGYETIGEYIVVKLYGMTVIVHNALTMSFWLGFYFLQFDGHGNLSVSYDPSDWAPGPWSQRFWWIPITPFACIPRDLTGKFHIYENGKYWEIDADADKILQVRGMDNYWTTYNGEVLPECTWPSKQ